MYNITSDLKGKVTIFLVRIPAFDTSTESGSVHVSWVQPLAKSEMGNIVFLLSYTSLFIVVRQLTFLLLMDYQRFKFPPAFSIFMLKESGFTFYMTFNAYGRYNCQLFVDEKIKKETKKKAALLNYQNCFKNCALSHIAILIWNLNYYKFYVSLETT